MMARLVVVRGTERGKKHAPWYKQKVNIDVI
jgi:hypothetical protein